MDKLENKKITFIGSGHIASAFIEGFIKSSIVLPQNITVSSPDDHKLQQLKDKFGIRTEVNNNDAIKKAEIIFLCVKPDIALSVLDEIRENIEGKVIISVAAGVTVNALDKRLGDNAKIFRVMPNIPIASNSGVLGILPNQNIKQEDKSTIESLLELIGSCFWLKDDREINVFTTISGCGPALVANFIYMVQKSAESLGLGEKEAESLAIENFSGALAYLKLKGSSPLELINSVATKGGVTAQIIDSMKAKKIDEVVAESLSDGMNRIKRLEEGIDK